MRQESPTDKELTQPDPADQFTVVEHRFPFGRRVSDQVGKSGAVVRRLPLGTVAQQEGIVEHLPAAGDCRQAFRRGGHPLPVQSVELGS